MFRLAVKTLGDQKTGVDLVVGWIICVRNPHRRNLPIHKRNKFRSHRRQPAFLFGRSDHPVDPGRISHVANILFTAHAWHLRSVLISPFDLVGKFSLGVWIFYCHIPCPVGK